MSDDDLERKLLDILDSEESAEISDADVQAAFPYLEEEMRAKLAKLLTTEMKSPEEIKRDAEINQHNDEVQRKRDERLLLRQERRAQKRSR